MATDDMVDGNEDFNSPHLPERYHQAVKAKRLRRLKRNIVIGCGVLVGIVVLYLVITAIIGGFFSTMPGAVPDAPPSPVTTPSAVATAQPVQTTVPGTARVVTTTTATVPAIDTSGRPKDPSVSIEDARAIADRCIIDENGGQLPLNMTRARYDPVMSPAGPVAGFYTFSYERIYNGFPTETDGFVVVVDASTGKVTEYDRQWTTQEYAFSSSAYAEIIRSEATFAVMQRVKGIYPDQVGTVHIISAEMLWKNALPEGTVPRPGSIPLAWRVVFDDSVIRQDPSLEPGVAWIDAQTGEFLVFEYRH